MTQIFEEKKDFFEGFTPEYIRCYLDKDVECGNVYDIVFKEIYKDGIKVELIKGE